MVITTLAGDVWRTVALSIPAATSETAALLVAAAFGVLGLVLVATTDTGAARPAPPVRQPLQARPAGPVPPLRAERAAGADPVGRRPAPRELRSLAAAAALAAPTSAPTRCTARPQPRPARVLPPQGATRGPVPVVAHRQLERRGRRPTAHPGRALALGGPRRRCRSPCPPRGR